jgi:hypothetical protein
MKQLERLEAKKLLKSKSYGMGEEKLWRLRKCDLLTQLGYTAPKGDVHEYLYQHEKKCGDILVSLVLARLLVSWDGSSDQKRGFRYDRRAELMGISNPIYLEQETGSQKPKDWIGKIEQYQKHFRETGEVFNVLFLMPESSANSLLRIFPGRKTGKHYAVAVHDQFVSDPLNALIRTSVGDFKLSNTVSNAA